MLPGVVLAVACILLFLKPLPLDRFLALCHVLDHRLRVSRPIPARRLKPVLAAMSQVEAAQEEAAALDGARLLRRLKDIIAPSVVPAAAAGAMLAFLLAFNELTVSALLWSAGTETVGVVLFSLEEAGLASQASAIALTTIVLVATIMGSRHSGRTPAGRGAAVEALRSGQERRKPSTAGAETGGRSRPPAG